MPLLKFALSQMKCEKGDIKSNLKVIEENVQEGSSHNCAIICFPEMCVTGYINPLTDPKSILNLSSQPIQHILKRSKEYHIIILAGFVEHNPNGKPFITQIAANDGKLLCVYRKRTIADDERV